MSFHAVGDRRPEPPARTKISGLHVEEHRNASSAQRKQASKAGPKSVALSEVASTVGVDDGNDGTEQVKVRRSRGRPRLDTKDETAADRRRTQIRLAQRAYRHRKDTAITGLEQRLKEMEEVQKSIHKQFSKFYDILLSEGVLNMAPHAATRLRPLADDIIRLSTSFPVGDSKIVSEGEDMTGPGQGQDQAPPAGLPNDGFLPPCPPMMSQGTRSNNGAMGASSSAHDASHSRLPMGSGLSQEYEVIAEPTSQNATFPFPFPVENLEMPHNPGHGPQLGTGGLTGMLPYPQALAHSSYSFQERSFSRRLHRFTTEMGLKFVLSSNPSPARFASVFGFTLMFEDKDTMIRRMLSVLKATRDQDLGGWTPAPKVLSDSQLEQLEKLYGVTGDPKAADCGGTEHGNFGPASLNEESDRGIQAILRNFEGDFVTPSEVEQFLNQMGVFIPPTADFVQAEVDLDAVQADLEFHFGPSNNHPHALPFQNPDPAMSVRSGEPSIMAAPSAVAMSSAPGMAMPGGIWAADNGSVCGPSVSNDPLTYDTASTVGGGSTAQTAMNSEHVFSTMHPEANSLLAHNYGHMWQSSHAWRKTKLTIDVTKLINEIALRSMCLGKSPGVRKVDVVIALKLAAGLPT